jgi:hypothetical protein
MARSGWGAAHEGLYAAAVLAALLELIGSFFYASEGVARWPRLARIVAIVLVVLVLVAIGLAISRLF